MIDFLALMVKMGRITLEQVPNKYLTEVTDLLNLTLLNEEGAF